MNAVKLTDRLTYWTERHPDWRPNPEWPEEVGCVLYLAADATVLIDPLIRDDLDPSGWTWLDEAVSTPRVLVAVLLTVPWHERSTREVVERYGARVWMERRARARTGDVPALDAIPEGIRVFTPRGMSEGQVAFLIRQERTLVVGEFFLGTASGLRVCPSPETTNMREFVDSLGELKRLPIERVLVAHGPPVLERGSEAIAAALQAFPAT